MWKYKSLLVLSVTLCFATTLLAQKEFALDDIVLNGSFDAETVSGFKSMNDGLHYTRLTENGTKIIQYAYKTGEKVKEIFSSDMLTYTGPKKIEDYEFSNDENMLLLICNKQKIYRHSFSAEYHVFDVRRKTSAPLSEQKNQRVAGFSPDGQKIAFVSDNNLFIKHLRFNTEYQVTKDGEINKILNGIPDWVYEEEFSFTKAWHWSPDSRFLAFIRFDESKVKEYSFPVYMGAKPALPDNELYPSSTTFKYPKAGEKNSEVEVKVFDSETKGIKNMKVAPPEGEFYVPRIMWTATADRLCVVTQNRHQSKMQILLANPKSGVASPILTEENDKYISEFYYDNIKFLDDNQHFVYLSEKDGFAHLYLYSIGGKVVRQITKGNWDVTSFYGYDATRKRFVFQAAKKSPLQREIYAIDEKNILTELSSQEGTNDATFSKTLAYFLKDWSNTSTPNEFSICDADGKQIRMLEDNKDLRDKLSFFNVKPKEFFKFVTSNGDTLNGWIMKPKTLKEDVKYPLLMVQYSGPNSQQVTDEYKLGWEQYLTGQGYIVACVDGRGTGARGQTFRKCTYMQLGKLEVEDQIEAAKYLGQKSFIDKDRIGIWGWSYGGFISSLCLSKSNGIFKVGIAVAPVTHYKFYDSIYTERYMRTPGENPKGYDENAPLELADKLTGRLLLIHGSGDDNVHYQNTIEYAERLVQADKQFDMQVYNNRNHSIYGGNTRLHLYTKKFEWLETYLK